MNVFVIRKISVVPVRMQLVAKEIQNAARTHKEETVIAIYQIPDLRHAAQVEKYVLLLKVIRVVEQLVAGTDKNV